MDKHTLKKIIYLPKDLFQPNATISTCIQVWQAHSKHGKNKEKRIEIFDFTDDGFIIRPHSNGRINVHFEEREAEFWKQIPQRKEFKPEDRWKYWFKLNYSKLSKLDFMKSKLDFMLINKNLFDDVLRQNGKVNIDIDVSDEELKTENWEEFELNKIFNINSSPNVKIDDFQKGDIPYVSATELNNGIQDYIKPNKNTKVEEENALTCASITGRTFFHPYPFVACGHGIITILRNKNLTLGSGLFISTIMSKYFAPNFCYSDQLYKEQLETLSIKLPCKGKEPDWKFMNDYLKCK